MKKLMLKKLSKDNFSKKWKNIGCHDTPSEIVEEFAKFVKKKIIACNLTKTKKSFAILDLFAGDGRLGNAVSESILNNFKSFKTTFVEVDKSKIGRINTLVHNPNLIHKDAFKWIPGQKFDLVVSNPPYQILNAKKAKRFGFAWVDAKRFTRNLYGLGIMRGLELCQDGGMLAVIAPFGWLRNINSEDFRNKIRSECSGIFIQAFNHRGLFKGVHQDIGFQIFIKKTKRDSKKAQINFKYNGTKKVRFSISNLKQKKIKRSVDIKTRIGSVVWNQKKGLLTTKGKSAIFLVYGGNIGHNKKISLNISKYKNKQYIRKSAINSNDNIKLPCILIRRILRGSPGNWKVDSCLLTSKFRFVAENHVIVVELPSEGLDYVKFHKQLIDELEKYYYISGSPSISVKVVDLLMSKVIKNKEILGKSRY